MRMNARKRRQKDLRTVLSYADYSSRARLGTPHPTFSQNRIQGNLRLQQLQCHHDYSASNYLHITIEK